MKGDRTDSLCGAEVWVGPFGSMFVGSGREDCIVVAAHPPRWFGRADSANGPRSFFFFQAGNYKRGSWCEPFSWDSQRRIACLHRRGVG